MCLGSPPLARGTATTISTIIFGRRITPACAGNSKRGYSITGCGGDHPRLRGEQYYMRFLATCQVGSPPLARGTGYTAKGSQEKWGITPACAGNSYFFSAPLKRRGDHPRLRGEQYYAFVVVSAVAGSPPLARGTGACCCFSNAVSGITPACAGNSEVEHSEVV